MVLFDQEGSRGRLAELDGVLVLVVRGRRLTLSPVSPARRPMIVTG